MFAKGVVLVEGDAELILVPAMLRSVFGVTPDELGFSVISVSSAVFEASGSSRSGQPRDAPNPAISRHRNCGLIGWRAFIVGIVDALYVIRIRCPGNHRLVNILRDRGGTQHLEQGR